MISYWIYLNLTPKVFLHKGYIALSSVVVVVVLVVPVVVVEVVVVFYLGLNLDRFITFNIDTLFLMIFNITV